MLDKRISGSESGEGEKVAMMSDTDARMAKKRCGLRRVTAIFCLIGLSLLGIAGWQKIFVRQPIAQAFFPDTVRGDGPMGEKIPLSFIGEKIRDYCHQVGKAAGENQSVENQCLLNEQFSIDELSDIDIPIPKKIIGHCINTSDAMGGSYQVMLKCVKDALFADEAMKR